MEGGWRERERVRERERERQLKKIEGGRWREEEVHCVSVGDRGRKRQTRRWREGYTCTCRGRVWGSKEGAGREGVKISTTKTYTCTCTWKICIAH